MNTTKTLEFRWTVSRGRDTYGYNICSLYADGAKVSSCNGGGYDMKGTSLGNWIARAYADRLLKLRPSQMPEQKHWERERARYCDDKCKEAYNRAWFEFVGEQRDSKPEDLPKLPEDCYVCPTCGGKTQASNDGKTVIDGRYFYGLTYHDPTYDPGKARIGKDTTDRTFGGSNGETVEEAEKAGKSLGLERYQAFYSASSKHPTKRHRVPLIDGGCGFSSVEAIMKAIGLQLRWINTRSKKTDLYELIDRKVAHGNRKEHKAAA